jgi:hydroxymethylpyrimidine/phosphomethylpyrimidine kinase
VFAGSDPSGGAGLQADLLTLAALGCHPVSVITAITVQDTTGVEAVQVTGARLVADQARLVLEDIAVRAIKIGMVGSAENAAAIGRVVAKYPDVPVVLDPVLASGRGDSLATSDGIMALRELIVPQATIVTPNNLEVRRLAFAGADRSDEPGSIEQAAQRLLALGADFVLVTGTHEPAPEVVNTLYAPSGIVRRDRWERLDADYHGSGCTLASAIAATLARGSALPDAVRDAQAYTWQTLAHGFKPGLGQRVPDRFFGTRQANKTAEGA